MSYPKTEEIAVSLTVNANFLLEGWLVYYGVLMRQAMKSDHEKDEVIKACKRIIEDLEADNEWKK